jgi:hypothetical protein
MAYIIKDTAGLINTRLTDVGRRYLSQGNFNISYFQIGDSEVNYSAVTNYNQTNNNILMPAFNAQNDTGYPESNKQNIKYPFFLNGSAGITYGIPYMNSQVQSVYNSASPKGFFTGNTEYLDYLSEYKIEGSSAYTITSNYWTNFSNLDGTTTKMELLLDPATCNLTPNVLSVNDFITLVYDGYGLCEQFSNNQILTYKIQEIVEPPNGETTTPVYIIVLDRAVPNWYEMLGADGYYGRSYIYPSGMTVLYDFKTPAPYWQTDTINFESPCDVSNRENTPIWNMNIPWSESPAGVFSSTHEDYTEYGSVTYIGTKEYLGYQSQLGQTDTSLVYYYNSFDERIVLLPEDQKAIAIIHFTNQDIDNVYGEKFATIPFDPANPTDSIGLARHFKLSIPTLMWHKSNTNRIGQDFYIDPQGYELCVPYFIKSTKNQDMNDPGIRYFHLWDTNPDSNGNLNRVGKVFPDQQIVVIDDEEIIAAMSYKSNRNWTLPAPKISLIPPNICQDGSPNVGILTNDQQQMWVTYRFDTQTGATSSLHCNYYSKIVGPSTECTDTTQNIAIRFGDEFGFLNDLVEIPDAGNNPFTGYTATSMKLIFQLTGPNQRPNPAAWKESDVTSFLTLYNGVITRQSLSGVTFVIDQTMYDNAVPYELQNYIRIPQNGQTEQLNFGDEYFFYGNIVTDISATIYEMKYQINLGNNQFTNTSNPSWTTGTNAYVSEIGLYNSQKELMVISKLQSPQLRQGIQQMVVKLDF